MGSADLAMQVAAQVEELRRALCWCLDEGMDEYVRETEVQRIAEYRMLLHDPLPKYSQ